MNESGRPYLFPVGHAFQAEDGQLYTVISFLGQGGQGDAYRVRGADGEFAVKFYHQDFAKRPFAENFRKNLIRNVESGAPQLSNGDTATQFVWPLKIIRPEQGSFGYLMRLFPEDYESLGRVIMQSRFDAGLGKRMPLRWKSYFACVTAGLNIVRAFEILHASGLSYQDLNDGGFSINMDTGNVLICDCDNVAPDGVNLGVLGVMNYMAPEVVCRKALPSRYTDEYSLAILLFRLFLHGHPMEGIRSRELHNSESMSRYEADQIIYGYMPHYCLAPGGGNRPDPVRNHDVCQFMLSFPRVLMDAFEQVFTKGVTDPSKRLTATEWRKVLLAVRDSLVLVNGREQFYNLRMPKPLPEECRTLIYPHERRVLCMPGKILYKYHLDEYGTDFKTPVGKVISSNKSGCIGLYNATGVPICFQCGGREGICPPEGRMPLLRGMELQLGKTKVKVE